MSIFLLLLAAFVLASALPANAEIRVIINGRQIYFEVPPTQINGRTMVPLRGVFEALGAEVRWNSSQRRVYAQRSGTEIELGVGDRNALVNRRTIYLDVPPAMMRGRVMVPLRFVAESLGSDVKWLSSTQTVEISDSQAGNSTPAGTNQQVQITEFTHNAQKPLSIGESLVFYLKGTPGGVAQVTVPGIGRTINMPEISPGTYSAGYPLSNKNPFANQTPSATLTVGNTRIQAKAAYPILINVPVWGQHSRPSPTPTAGQSYSLQAPIITSPSNGAMINTPINISGRANPNTTVVVSVASVTSSGQNGGKSEQKIRSDTRGNFNTTITPQTTGSQTKHYIQVYQLNSRNRRSPASSIQVYQQ